MTDLIQNYRTCKVFAEMLNITSVEKKKMYFTNACSTKKADMVLTSFTQI